MVEATFETIDDIVIFVLGTTGVGKSKLAMDLATHPTLFGDVANTNKRGEIINADSMQVYSGNLNGAMTARPTPEDLKRAPHHLYDCVPMRDSPLSDCFNVQKYRDMALAKIAEVQARGNVPIICGGTNYYTEALLFTEGTA